METPVNVRAEFPIVSVSLVPAVRNRIVVHRVGRLSIELLMMVCLGVVSAIVDSLMVVVAVILVIRGEVHHGAVGQVVSLMDQVCQSLSMVGLLCHRVSRQHFHLEIIIFLI